MKPMAITTTVGLLTLGLGCVGLFDPRMVVGFVGFDMASASHVPAALSEVRAVYGGLFTVIGAFTLLAAHSPASHRTQILFIGLLWLGLCGGRLLGVWIDGSPGLKGWLCAAFELAMGLALLITLWAEPLSSAGAETERTA